jgi:protein-disulfide isomerase
VLAKYRGKVKLAYRDFPLASIHAHAEMAAEAARRALEQEKYWEMHDALFASQAKLEEADLVRTAAGVGMDQNAFESCLKSGSIRQRSNKMLRQVRKWESAQRRPSLSTARSLNGAQPKAEFEKIIDSVLAATVARDSARAVR